MKLNEQRKLEVYQIKCNMYVNFVVPQTIWSVECGMSKINVAFLVARSWSGYCKKKYFKDGAWVQGV